MTARAPARGSRWIEGWNPEDEEFWESTGRAVARRNLIFSIVSEHIGFSVWSIWSVLVLFMSPEIGLPFTAAEKFLLVVTPNLVGAVLRLPYAAAVTRFGGRNWTVFSSAVLLVPAGLACYFVQQPGTPLWVFLLIGATAGVGGGNFASSMTNITTFFPQRHQGWALGLNAGGGNLGVAAVQVVGLLVIAVAGSTSPAYVAAVYLPLIVLAALCAALFMDNVDSVRARPGALLEAAANRHTWWISLLYIGTFGSFIGYSFAFGLVLQTEFGFTPLQAAGWTFLGPLLGSVARPAGGWLSDRLGGARVTAWTFVGLTAGTAALLVASAQGSFAGYVAAFIALFVLTGVGNGSTYKMIPAIFAREAEDEVTDGGEAIAAFARARRLSGAVIGIAGAVGALGGVGINLAFRASYGGEAASGDSALLVFLGYYLLCVLVTWAIYLRDSRAEAPAARPEAEVTRA
ncbi:MFS transporter, NNP family, nitrate/nitrite transporter [Saccharopolyspora kobensis]|uniref:MFS transporter, NNP family, nitrate/nitrite transporter n=1 Tax=Saccharopolyspora kobensis TaxID=146035 RepID=A0A1H5XE03_9PSEU|nr:nitrate/nitrite transporter [Saccharopolyspora kobensis]SEG09949.1 MFS transporter, NNP family, nitrate/nitrite transporter [Saccharopolyspora kobensis]SFE44055.1 MFS transporter, NNP family, nitrate/nitrite transporter [Saccharopolyspora kobensis]